MKGTSLFLLFLLGCATERLPQEKSESLINQQLQQCYEESDSFKAKEGSMDVVYTVTEDGKVLSPKIRKTDFKDANFHACVLGIIKSMTYKPDAKRGTIEVNQPINFFQKINEDV